MIYSTLYHSLFGMSTIKGVFFKLKAVIFCFFEQVERWSCGNKSRANKALLDFFRKVIFII